MNESSSRPADKGRSPVTSSEGEQGDTLSKPEPETPKRMKRAKRDGKKEEKEKKASSGFLKFGATV